MYFRISVPVSTGNADLGTSGCSYSNRNETPECNKFHRYDAGSYVPPPNLCDSSNRYYEMDTNFFLLSLSTYILVPRDEATLFSRSHHLVKEIQCKKVTYIDIILLIQRNSAPPRMYKNFVKKWDLFHQSYSLPFSNFRPFPSIHPPVGCLHDSPRIIGTPISQKGHWYKEIKHIQRPVGRPVFPGSEMPVILILLRHP